MLTSIADIKKANAAMGHHFFEAGTMRFFRSRVLPRVFGGRYFITSERFSDTTPRRYTIREALEDGRVDTVGAFMGYESAREARASVAALIKGGV